MNHHDKSKISRKVQKISKGPKYRFPSKFGINICMEEIASALNVLVIDGVNEVVLNVML